MNDELALRIVSSLAAGVDPASGAALPAESSLQQPEIVRALYAAARALEAGAKAGQRARASEARRPGNAGVAWSVDEDQSLVESFESGSTEAELAESHQRTRSAIRLRLIKLGKVEPLGGERMR